MASKKKKKKVSKSRSKSPRTLLRSVIDDMEHGRCGSAALTLVEAATKAPSRGKMKKHLDAVAATFSRTCVRGGGGFNVPPAARVAPRPNAFAKLYQHAGPKGRLPGARPPQHGGSMRPSPPPASDWWGYPGADVSPRSYAPGTNTIPPLRGLGRHRWSRSRRGR